MFLSTFEKQLDSKRRLVVPQEFRAAVSGPFDGIFCFPSIEADCLEAGGKAARPDGSPYRGDEYGRTGLLGASTPALWDELAALYAHL